MSSTAKAMLVCAAAVASVAAKRPDIGDAEMPPNIDQVDYCKTCLHMVNDIEKRLLPKLIQTAAKRDATNKKYQKSLTFGDVDDLIDTAVEDSCKAFEIWNSIKMRKSCTHIVENVGEEFNNALSKWTAQQRPVSELRTLL